MEEQELLQNHVSSQVENKYRLRPSNSTPSLCSRETLTQVHSQTHVTMQQCHDCQNLEVTQISSSGRRGGLLHFHTTEYNEAMERMNHRCGQEHVWISHFVEGKEAREKTICECESIYIKFSFRQNKTKQCRDVNICGKTITNKYLKGSDAGCLLGETHRGPWDTGCVLFLCLSGWCVSIYNCIYNW